MAEPMQIEQTGGEDRSQPAAQVNIQDIPKCLAQDKLRTLAKKLGTQGTDFGISLGFELSDLGVFDRDNVRDVVQATWKMLVMYTQEHPDTDLVGKFVKELKATGRTDLALVLQAEAQADLKEQQAEAEAAGDLR